jgi:hypothetical protein
MGEWNMIWLKQIAILSVGLAGGAYANDAMRTKTKHEVSFPYTKTATAVSGQMGCKSIAAATVNGGGLGSTDKITAKAEAGTDQMALEIGDKHIAQLTQAAVRIGIMDASKMTIYIDNNDLIGGSSRIKSVAPPTSWCSTSRPAMESG